MEGAPQTTGYGAFLADVNLSADVQWNGTLKLTWMTAQVCGIDSGGATRTRVVATTTPMLPSTTQTTVAPQTTQQGQTTNTVQGTDTSPTAAQTTTAQTTAAQTTAAPTTMAPTTAPPTTTAPTTAASTTQPGDTGSDTSTTTDDQLMATETSSPDNSSQSTLPMTLAPTTMFFPEPPSLPPGSQVPPTDPPTLPPLTGTIVTAVNYTFNITYRDGISLHRIFFPLFLLMLLLV